MSLHSYEIRRGVAADSADIEALVHAAYGKWVPIIGRNPLPMDVDYDTALKQHRFDLLHQTEGETTRSSLAAMIETYEEGECLFIENLCVSPKFQRKGLGKLLMQYAQDLAGELQKSCMRLDTNKLFSGNVELYQSLGFKTEWEKPVKGGIHVRMCKTL